MRINKHINMVHNYKNTTGPFLGKVIKVGTVAMQLIIFLSFGFINIQQSIQTRLDPAIFQKWLHSYEEDTQGIKIYRQKVHSQASPSLVKSTVDKGLRSSKNVSSECFRNYHFESKPALLDRRT